MIALLTTHKILNKRRIKGLVYRAQNSVIFIGPGLQGSLGRGLRVYNVFDSIMVWLWTSRLPAAFAAVEWELGPLRSAPEWMSQIPISVVGLHWKPCTSHRTWFSTTYPLLSNASIPIPKLAHDAPVQNSYCLQNFDFYWYSSKAVELQMSPPGNLMHRQNNRIEG